MKASVAIDCRAITWPGLGAYIKNIIPRLLQSNAITLTCLGRRNDMERYEWFSMIKFIELDSKIFSPIEQVELPVKIPKCDIFWAPHFNIPLFYSGRLLVTIQDARVVALSSQVKGVHRRLYAKVMYFFLGQKADAIISASEFTKGELIRVAGIDSGLIHLVYNGLDSSWFKIARRARPHPRPYLLFVGNIKPHKNLANLVSAFRQIMGKIPQDLLIVGEKERLMMIDKKAIMDASCLGDRVYFTGYVEDSALQQYYAYTDVLVFPSFYEGFGLPPLEAMACGCPVVASKSSSLPEICSDAALYCDPYDPKDIANKIVLVLTDITLRDSLIQKGLERSRQFTWEKTAAETLEVIKKVL